MTTAYESDVRLREKLAARQPIDVDESALPPGPRGNAILRSIQFFTDRGGYLPKLRRTYGDTFSFTLIPAGHVVVLTRAEDIRAIFAGSPADLHAGEGNAILGPVMGEHSVLLLDEAEHLAARKKVMAAFHGETIAAWSARVEELAAAEIATFPTGRPFELHTHMNNISLEVILRIVFGLEEGPKMDELRPLLRKLVQIGPVTFLGAVYPQLMRVPPWRDFGIVRDRMDAAIYREITDRRTVPDLAERTDMLSRLIVADPAMTDAELRDHLVTMLIAGHETTASSLAWSIHELVRSPSEYTLARQAADVGDEAYLTAVTKETLRRRPVINLVARRTTVPVTVGGYDLPAGVVVFPAIQLVQMEHEHFPNPREFRASRFLNGAPPPGTWIPFGGGVRRCLGVGLATMESVAVLKTLLRTVDLQAVDQKSEGAKVRNITLVPGKGTRVIATPR